MTGRKIRLKKGSSTTAVAIIGARSEDLTVANGEVDVTDKDDNGYRTLLDDWAQRSIDVTVAGVLKDASLITIATSSSGTVLLSEHTLEIEGIGEFVGDFYLNGLQIGAPHDNVATFSATFLSSGEYTFTSTP
jgi:predicted secreted protein